MPKSQKGSRFEREFCRDLSLWISGGEKDDLFWRTAGSGARATTRGKQGKRTVNQDGDVTSTCEESEWFIHNFLIELKRGYSKHTIQDLWDNPNGAMGKYEEWISHIITRIQRSHSWMLIHKRDRREALVFMPTYVIKMVPFRCLYDNCTRLVRMNIPIRTYFLCQEKVERVRICCFPLKEFFSLVDPQELKECI